jgi:hypothetical protein
VGRWWALLAAVAAGVVVGLMAIGEDPGWSIGLGVGLFAAIGVAAGVLLRRLAKKG